MLKAPFPYFGGKARIAARVWQALGDVTNYVEPFCGSAAVLLARPHAPRIETVNDADGLISNFWRAVQAEPDAVAHHADWPVNENDLHARHAWLVGECERLHTRLEGNPAYYDAKIAGWWCWGLCCWIGSGFCSGKGPWHVVDGKLLDTRSDGKGVRRKLVHLGDAGQGVHRKLVHLGDAGQGVHRTLVHLGDAGKGVHRKHGGLLAWMQALCDRLRRVRVCCGDWTRVVGPCVTTKNGLTGVFLDPPYSHAERDNDLYRCELATAEAVRAWALEHGDDPRLRIVLCGYDGEHAMPDTWTAIAWKTPGGFGAHGKGRGRANTTRERLWLSPHCVPLAQEVAACQ